MKNVNPSARISPRGAAGPAILIAMFALSVLIRIPYLGKPMDSDLDRLPCNILRPLQSWYADGALKYGFCPVMNYPGRADKNINNHGGPLKDEKGNYYYTSFPPFTYIAPYAMFKLFSIYPDALPLRIFNLFFHFLCCLLIYLIIRILTDGHCAGRINAAPLIGAALYAFSPTLLKFHGEYYDYSVFVQPLYLLGIYAFLKLISGGYKKRHYFYLGLTNFLMVYTEWLGSLYALSVSLYALALVRRREMRIVLLMIIATSMASLSLTILQYSSINGLKQLSSHLTDRFVFRTGLAQEADGDLHYWNLRSWKLIASYYKDAYMPFLSVMCLFGIAACVMKALAGGIEKSCKATPLNDTAGSTVLYLCAAPVILHHLILFNETCVHPWTVIKTGGGIAILTALIYQKILDNVSVLSPEPGRGLNVKVGETLCIILIGASVFWSVFNYITDSGRTRYSNYEKTGREIARRARDTDVLFVKLPLPFENPMQQLVYHAHRNMAAWRGEEAGLELLKLNGSERGIAFTLNQRQDEILRTDYISQNHR